MINRRLQLNGLSISHVLLYKKHFYLKNKLCRDFSLNIYIYFESGTSRSRTHYFDVVGMPPPGSVQHRWALGALGG